MRNLVLFSASFVCLCYFSFCAVGAYNLVSYWLFVELLSLSLLPAFFVGGSCVNSSVLFIYLVTSGISSVMMVSGFMFAREYCFLVFWGFMVKFGVFPFFGWVYVVLLGSSWYVAWCLGTFLKIPFLWLYNLGGSVWVFGFSSFIVLFFVGVTLVFLSWLIWVFTLGWKHFWCHSVVSSSAVFLGLLVCQRVDYVFFLFFVYFLWSSVVVLLLNGLRIRGNQSSVFYLLLVSTLIAFPISFAIVYKIISAFCVFSCGFVVFVSWVLYGFSEQLFLVKLLVSEGKISLGWSGASVV